MPNFGARSPRRAIAAASGARAGVAAATVSPAARTNRSKPAGVQKTSACASPGPGFDSRCASPRGRWIASPAETSREAPPVSTCRRPDRT